jgi:DUF1009 family protein
MRVICAGLSGSAWEDLPKEVDEFKWVGIVRIGQWIRFLKRNGVREAIMVGRVTKTKMYSRWRYLQYIPDLRTARLWFTEIRKDKRPRTMLNLIACELASEGITLIDSTKYTQDQLVTPGVLTRHQPSPAQMEDARFGWELCKKVSAMDIGQSIAVLGKDVIAVEALEGTNAMIDRAGELCRTGGWTLIKVANAEQDMRMDVPTIGVTTVEKLAQAKAGCVVLEVGKTVLLEREKVLALADRHGIAVVGFE